MPKRVNFPVQMIFILGCQVFIRRGNWKINSSPFQNNTFFIPFYSFCWQGAHNDMISKLTHAAFSRMSEKGKEGWVVLEQAKNDLAAASSQRNIKSQKENIIQTGKLTLPDIPSLICIYNAHLFRLIWTRFRCFNVWETSWYVDEYTALWTTSNRDANLPVIC